MNKLFESIYSLSPQKAYRYFARGKRAMNTRRLVNDYLKNNDYRKLHLGCGGNFISGWLNSDLIPHNKRTAMMDASKPFPVPDKSFNLVYSEHLFEHLDITGQLNYLSECRRILKPGGRLRIATPDFDFLIKLTSEQLSEVEQRHLQFNAQHFLSAVPQEVLQKDLAVYVINNYVRDWGHQLLHNKSSLRTLVEHAGFSGISFHEVGESAEPAFVNIERHHEMIGAELNKLETMILEASA